MPSPVDKYYDQVKRDNPDYSEAQAWATAWSIYCKYKNPGSDSCKKPQSEYLKGKNAAELAFDEVLERAYFHTNNGGLTLSVVRIPGDYPTYKLRYTMSSMGAEATGSFNLGHPNMVAWMVGALTRTVPRIEADQSGRTFIPFEPADVSAYDGVHKEARAFQDALIARNVVARIVEAGPVVPFKPKPGVPTELIAGRKYVLSTDGGPLGDREDDDDHGWAGRGDEGGARLIVTPQTGSKFRYLWAYDTDKQYLAMWRVTDGNEKFGGRASSEQARIVKLEKKGQLNRVTHEEFRKVEKEMRKREDDAMAAMQRSVEDAKDDQTKQVDRLVREFYDKHVEDKLVRALDAAERGAIPLGFKPHGPGESDPEWRKRQVAAFVLGQMWRREMSIDKVSDYLRGKGVDVEEAGQWVDFAIQDVFEAVSDKLLPERPAYG